MLWSSLSPGHLPLDPCMAWDWWKVMVLMVGEKMSLLQDKWMVLDLLAKWNSPRSPEPAITEGKQDELAYVLTTSTLGVIHKIPNLEVYLDFSPILLTFPDSGTAPGSPGASGYWVTILGGCWIKQGFARIEDGRPMGLFCSKPSLNFFLPTPLKQKDRKRPLESEEASASLPSLVLLVVGPNQV